MNPPPPGAAGDAVEPDVRTIIVPAGTVLPAVPLFELPTADAVANVITEVPIVQMFVVADGVTLASIQVVAALL